MKVDKKGLSIDIEDIISEGIVNSEEVDITTKKIMGRIADLIAYARKDRIRSLFHYSVALYKPSQRWSHTDEFKQETVDVIAENDKYLILDNMHFTKVQKGGRDSVINPVLDKENVWMRTKESVLGNGVFYSCYTTQRKTPPEIRAKVKNFIDKEIGYLGNLNLDIIK